MNYLIGAWALSMTIWCAALTVYVHKTRKLAKRKMVRFP